MEATAFCPAHITGFFKAYLDENDQKCTEDLGSMGAGFSIKDGVTTRVITSPKVNQKSSFRITTSGYQSDKIDISKFVLNEFLRLGNFKNIFFDVYHNISIPVGYGLGSSAAVALSLSYALDQVLRTKLNTNKIGQIAHNAEINCKTGLGDVLASYHGGFEIRVKAGAPGIGHVEKIDIEPITIFMVCFSPISTNKFIKERLSQINGLGGKMVNRLLESKDYKHFQDMSLEFAKYIQVMTPRMDKLIEDLSANGIKCGVALFGETVFIMASKEKVDNILKILEKYSEGIIIKSELDEQGARVLYNN
jgi:pantoate kinase